MRSLGGRLITGESVYQISSQIVQPDIIPFSILHHRVNNNIKRKTCSQTETIYKTKIQYYTTKTFDPLIDVSVLVPGGGGVLDISLDGEVRRGPSYPDPV